MPAIGGPAGGGSVEGIEDVPGLESALAEKVSHEELDEAIQDLDFPEPVIEQFVTNIAVHETFVTELTENSTFIEETVNQITLVEEDNTYIEQITNNNTYISQFNTKINGKKGVANELASLDGSGKLTSTEIPTKLTKRVINFVIDGGGSAIATGVKGDVEVPFAWTDIESATILADQSGAIVIDVWKDTYANFPPVAGDKITASAPPTITASGTKSRDTTLTGWTKTGAAGDVLRFNVTSVTSIQRATLSLVLVI